MPICSAWPLPRPHGRYIEQVGGAARLCERYDFVFCVDDDIRMGPGAIRTLVAEARQRHLLFASPTYDAQSAGVWRYFDGVEQGQGRVRFTNFVENTAVLLSSQLFLQPVFRRCLAATLSGCYLDFCFWPCAGFREDKVAIIDAAVCHHPERQEASELEEVRRGGGGLQGGAGLQAWHANPLVACGVCPTEGGGLLCFGRV